MRASGMPTRLLLQPTAGFRSPGTSSGLYKPGASWLAGAAYPSPARPALPRASYVAAFFLLTVQHALDLRGTRDFIECRLTVQNLQAAVTEQVAHAAGNGSGANLIHRRPLEGQLPD